MSDTVKVRIGLEGARELELVVADGDAVAKALEKAIGKGGLVWVEDAKGDRHGIAVERLAFVEVEGEDKGAGVGFSPPAAE